MAIKKTYFKNNLCSLKTAIIIRNIYSHFSTSNTFERNFISLTREGEQLKEKYDAICVDHGHCMDAKAEQSNRQRSPTTFCSQPLTRITETLWAGVRIILAQRR